MKLKTLIHLKNQLFNNNNNNNKSKMQKDTTKPKELFDILDNQEVTIVETETQSIKSQFDRGLFERIESAKTILVEDNRQLLND